MQTILKKLNPWKTPKAFLIDSLYYIVGSILFAVSIYTFAKNANFAPGGVSGLSLIVYHFTGLPIGLVSLVINLPLILICAKVIGLKFLVKSSCTIIIYTIFIDLVFPKLPTYKGDPLLAALFTGVTMGIGAALIYMRGSSTGGTDFIILTIKKLRPHLSVGQISLVIDAATILLGGLVFKSVDALLYGIIATFACSVVLDRIMYGASGGKLAQIITTRGQDIADAITEELSRGSTIVQATGTYTKSKREILYCVCFKNEVVKVRHIVEKVDRDALIMISEVNEVLGEGFAPPKLPGHETKLRIKPPKTPVSHWKTRENSPNNQNQP